MANIRFYADLRTLAKRANQRMVRLEKAGIKSPAYQAVQAKLEMLGRNKVSDTKGRRFSETGKTTYQEYEHTKKVLEEFLGSKTSTTKGAKEYLDKMYKTANEKYGLSDLDITKEDWGEFWQNMPSNKKDRLYGSGQVINMMRAYKAKNGDIKPDDIMTGKEIADAINQSKDVKTAYRALGITYKDIKENKSLGDL